MSNTPFNTPKPRTLSQAYNEIERLGIEISKRPNISHPEWLRLKAREDDLRAEILSRLNAGERCPEREGAQTPPALEGTKP